MRRGVRKISKIPPEILVQLNQGNIESATLVESLAIDFDQLAKSLNLNIKPFKEKSIIKRMQYYGLQIDDWQEFKNHLSDTIRGWCAFSLAQKSHLTFEQKLQEMLFFADDHHFGVREWAWLSIRNQIIENLDQSLKILTPLTIHKSANIRRFACEITRPRGVWCQHIKKLKEQPWLAIDILENLKTDSSKYVQNSIGNWLNDASKDNSIWVLETCKSWQKINNLNTNYIAKRGCRTITKKPRN